MIGTTVALHLLCLTSLLNRKVGFFILEKIATFLATSGCGFPIAGRAKSHSLMAFGIENQYPPIAYQRDTIYILKKATALFTKLNKL